eukprot:TRINITY_DN18145_c0_g1_i1.p1 TRINITY_DN18145_c0_g1~~TRINITY_DN18145_c0_g1_i1.p1  ORF type:complete len:125 (+),score=13.37 TRINITY_DN18145_c0_g1_i1:516-890(+)
MLQQQGRGDCAAKLQKEYNAGTTVSAKEIVTPAKGPLIAVILYVFILPEHRRNGFAATVLDHWVTLAKTVNATTVEFWLPRALLATSELPQCLAAKHFEMIGERKLSAKAPEASAILHMQLELS